MTGFTRAQVGQLLQPINSNRVLRDGKGHSHVSQQDVLAHLIRVFGFGNFDTEVLSVECVFEAERTNAQTGAGSGKWDVCYKAMVRLTVKDPDGNVVARYEDGSTATAENQKRGDAHDLAYKSAISLSKKRAAIPLGDQFGLSLYNKGQQTALVRGTMVLPEGAAAEDDVQDGVEKQVSLGNDEIDRDLDGGPAPQTSPEPATPIRVQADTVWVEDFEKRLADAVTEQINSLRQEVLDAFKAKKFDPTTANRLMDAVKTRMGELTAADAA